MHFEAATDDAAPFEENIQSMAEELSQLAKQAEQRDQLIEHTAKHTKSDIKFIEQLENALKEGDVNVRGPLAQRMTRSLSEKEQAEYKQLRGNKEREQFRLA